MTRLLIGFILSLYVLLPGGLAHGFSLEKTFEGSARARFFAEQLDAAQICATDAPGARKARDKVKAIEIQEDEDPGSSRKDPAARKPRIIFYIAPVDSYTTCGAESQLPFCEHFSYAASPKFIMHRVIRI